MSFSSDLPPPPPPPPTRATADICDHFYERIADSSSPDVPVRVLAALPAFQIFGAYRSFSGPVTTLKVFEDNSLVRAALEEPGNGRVLVIDGGASLRCALLGGNLAQIAATNGWRGILVNGCVRDVEEVNSTLIGVRALAAHPLKSFKRRQGERDVAVIIGGVRIRPGDWCYSDADGIAVVDATLALC